MPMLKTKTKTKLKVKRKVKAKTRKLSRVRKLSPKRTKSKSKKLKTTMSTVPARLICTYCGEGMIYYQLPQGIDASKVEGWAKEKNKTMICPACGRNQKSWKAVADYPVSIIEKDEGPGIAVHKHRLQWNKVYPFTRFDDNYEVKLSPDGKGIEIVKLSFAVGK
jgi:Zn finger protein HypA/HybF involved in hydrogenase expression